MSDPELSILRELGEWATVGFYEAAEEPWPISCGRALRRLYENMPIQPCEEGHLVPCEPIPGHRDGAWPDDPWSGRHKLVLGIQHHTGLGVLNHNVEAKKKLFPHRAAFIDDLVRDLEPRLPYFGGWTHCNPDMRRVVCEGFDSMEAQMLDELAAIQREGDPDAAQLNLFLTLKEYCIGVRAFHNRTAAALAESAARESGPRRERLELVLREFRVAFLEPSHTFVQGLLAVHFTWMLDACDSIGRFDQVLGDLFEADLSAGRLDVSFARQLLDEVFMAFERLGGWNMQIGGRRPDGADGCNRLTEEILDACRRNKFRRPNVAFRISRDTPKKALVKALDVLKEGTGRPALYNDDLYIETLLSLDLGLTPEDAREYSFGGCTETMIGGMSNVGSLDGTVNLLKAFERALWNGYDPIVGVPTGPRTGLLNQFPNFESFLHAVKRQIQYATDVHADWHSQEITRRYTRGEPKLARTMFTRDCIRNRKSFEAGGARYNWSVSTYQGIANLIDSLSAVRKFVFEDKAVTPRQLLDALATDWRGHERVRQLLLSAPRFGNDDPIVDAMAAEIFDFACREMLSHSNPRGGRYLPSCIVFVTYGRAGLDCAATPDGRRAREPLADSVGPLAGHDRCGPTAMLKSVTRLPLSLAAGTPVLNIRLQREHVDRHVEKVADMVLAYFAMGGMQIQVSVLNRQDMLDAQQRPAEHQDLIVRIGGYSEFFTRLDRPMQDTVIARTEHGGL